MNNSSVQSSSWNDMTRSSSICKALPARSTEAVHEKQHHNTSAANWKQHNIPPIHLSSTAEEGRSESRRSKMKSAVI